MKLWQKYALALALVALVPLGIATWQIVTHDREELQRSARDYHLATADVALGTIRSLLERAVAEARTVGAALAQPSVTPEERERTVRAQLIGSGIIDQLAVYSPDGAQVFHVRAPRDGVRGALEPPAQLDEDSRRIALDQGRLPWRVERRSDGAPVLPFVFPIKRPGGELYAYGWTDVDLSDLSDDVAELSRRRFGGVPGLVRVVDEQLRVIAAADPAELWRDLAGRGPLEGVTSGAALRKDVAHTVDTHRDDGTAVIGAVVPLPELGWGVIVEEYAAEAYAAVARSTKTALLVGAIFAALAVLVGVWAARRFAAPVVSVSRAAQQVAGGDFAARVAVTGGDEVGRMAGAFNDMARDLGDYRERLVEETRVRGNLSRFLSPDVVESVVVGAEDLRLGGERREITVMFADVVAFTELVEERSPEFVVGILNELFTIITEIVFKHGGIIDKFIGDCAMAVWGAPRKHDDDAQRAVRAAEEILRWLEVGNAKWRKELGRDVQLAIGIHTGTAVVGNIGSEKRMEYTAIGDVVNVAARLERLARPGQILVTKNTMAHISGEFDATSLGNIDIVGRNRTSEIFLLEE
ncbi:MAG: HAMP domain-containing protein [Myxococcales bacterium]|nr:HAMP domain-containing protein [Myxococcales bacterium]MCB9735026.1 HAMP domain-containing protein [Deltaproteobacteria bacterium]